MNQQEDLVFKVFTLGEFSSFEESGEFWGSEHDKRDGFIHLSSSEQVQGVVERYFKNRGDLVICSFNIGNSPEVKWELSSSGEAFPHLYKIPLSFAGIVEKVHQKG